MVTCPFVVTARPLEILLILLGCGAFSFADEPSPFPEIAPAAHDGALETLHATAKSLAEGRQLKMRAEFESPLLIYTDWPENEPPALHRQLARTYASIVKRLGGATGQNVFRGALLVLAVKDRKSFDDLAGDMELPGRDPDDLGTFIGRSDGLVLAVVCRPSLPEDVKATTSARRDLQHRWSASCARVVSAAVVFRMYAPLDAESRGDRKADDAPWLERGLSVMIQHDLVPPRPVELQYLRDLANVRTEFDLNRLFEQELPHSALVDAATANLVRMLNESNPRGPSTMLRRVREGASGEAALRATYRVDYEQLVERWRKYLQTYR
jgi:hypothetical protein